VPIRPENKNRYPKEWDAISRSIRERAGNKCEECGVPNYELGGRDPDGVWHKALPVGERLLRTEWPQPGEYAWCRDWPRERLRILRIVLTVAHLNHKPEDCRPENLKAWCQRCHLRYDAAMHRQGRNERARAQRACGDLFVDGE
jgi:5-methylcytosine-specific restriction endonuclease McrA